MRDKVIGRLMALRDQNGYWGGAESLSFDMPTPDDLEDLDDDQLLELFEAVVGDLV